MLSTFIEWPEPDIAALIFHELAHQELYIKGDTKFNESFAEIVSQEGVSRWLSTRNDPEALNRYLKNEAQHRIVMDLLMDTAEDLRNLYKESITDEQKRVGKKAAFSSLRGRFQSLKETNPSFNRFERWIFRDLNNTRFSLLSTYHGYIPSFRALLAECLGDLARFYEKAGRIGSFPDKERKDALARLVAGNE